MQNEQLRRLAVRIMAVARSPFEFEQLLKKQEEYSNQLGKAYNKGSLLHRLIKYTVSWGQVFAEHPIEMLLFSFTAWLYIGLSVVIFVWLLTALPSIQNEIEKWPDWLKMPLAIVAILPGWLLFRYRKYKRRWYGATEIIFGVALAYYSTRSQSDTAQVISLLGAFFVIARGFDNWREGNDKLRIESHCRDSINPSSLLPN